MVLILASLTSIAMKRSVKRILILIPVIIIVILGGLLTYVKTALPDVGPAPDIKVAGTPEQIERGRYLTNHVALCIECHSTRDFNVFSGLHNHPHQPLPNNCPADSPYTMHCLNCLATSNHHLLSLHQPVMFLLRTAKYPDPTR